MQNVYVFDIDGTIADPRHRLHWLEHRPKNWKKFFLAQSDDTPIPGMWELMVSLSYNSTNKIILQTGRPETYRIQTVNWLTKHGFYNHVDSLLMRADDDRRPNTVVKLEFLDFIESRYGKPTLWFEDAPAVVQSIIKQGITALSAEHLCSETLIQQAVGDQEIPFGDRDED